MRGNFSYELVYGSHLTLTISVIKQFESEEDAEHYLIDIYSRLPACEQVNYWIRPLEKQS